MIQAVMVISTQAKPRLLKFYSFQPPEKHQDLVRCVFQLLSARPESASNFVKVDSIFGPGTKMVYKHLATLYFVFVFDSSENELAMLDLVQVFVETLDRCFKNVCELDIVFNFNKAAEKVGHRSCITIFDSSWVICIKLRLFMHMSYAVLCKSESLSITNA
uniref:AP complex mu/sigma subunit domain-containing protein n=1 Tax=Zea mays TaxID=4577 RepID=C4IZU0_MAIZE|nr:unknown [Zea mays]